MKLLPLPELALLAPQVYGFFDDFQGFLTAQSGSHYTVVTAVDGTVLRKDARGGGVDILSAAASAAGNEDTYLAREPEAFLPVADKPIIFEALEQNTEDDVNQNNLIVGLTDGVAANLLVNDGAGPKTTGSTLAFFKKDGGLNWWVHASLGAAQQSVELTAVNSLDKVAHVSSGAAAQRLRIEFCPKNATQSDVLFFIDGVLVYKITDWVFTSATEMQAVAGVKDGDAGDEVTMNLRYWFCYQKR